MEHIPPYFWGTAIFLFGLALGSFFNVVIYRLPRGQSLAFPGSHCTSCNAPVKPYDNIPVISYLILRGRCRSCKASYSVIYPIVEFLVGSLYLLLFLKDGLTLTLAADVVFVSLLIPLIFIDLEHKLLPDIINKPGLVVMAALRVLAPDPAINASTRHLFGVIESAEWTVAIIGCAFGAAVGGGSLWLVREAYLRIKKTEGMGLGDVKMMLMVGAFLGWKLTFLTIFLASLIGSLIGILVMRRKGGTLKMEIPFGVFLGPAAIISLFLGQVLIDWYMSFYS
jgi:leader peptidase (prepilin peptidase)/N-methyltransferase